MMKILISVLLILATNLSHAGELDDNEMKNTKKSVSIEKLEVEGLGVATIGMPVSHKYFGSGTIIELAEFPDKTHTINIDFGKNGTKWLVPEYANLKPRK